MPFDAPIHTNEANLPRVLNAGLPLLLVFWRRDCAPCEQLSPVLDRLAKAYAGKALITKVNVGEEPGLAQRYGTAHLPALLFFKGGQQVERAVGAATQGQLAAWLDYLVAGGTRPPVPHGPSMPVHAGGSPAAEPARETSEPAARTGTADTAAGPGQPIVLTDATFDQVVAASRTPVLVDFWAEWCGPCKMIAPAVAQLAREYVGQVVVAKLNVDENPRTAGRFGVMSIPTLLIFKGGQVVDQIVGAQPAPVLKQRLARWVG